MKSVIALVSLFVMSVFMLSGCLISFDSVNGNGKIVTEGRNEKNFTGVNLEGVGNVYISQGDEESIKIETDENILPLIITEVRNGTLVLNSLESISPTRLNFYITVKNIKNLEIDGSGNIYGNNEIISDDLNLMTDGSGDFKFDNIKIKNLSLRISGSGDMRLSGNAVNSECQIKGSGDVDMLYLDANSARVRIDGSGNCRLSVRESLWAIINGSGDVYYKGKPKELRTEVNGSGDIREIH
jgi:hypothetical protein